MNGYQRSNNLNVKTKYSVKSPKQIRSKCRLSSNYLEYAFHQLRSTSGEGAGPDNVKFDSYSTTMWRHHFNRLATSITNETYKVGPTMDLKKEKEGGGYRKIQINNVIDRVASKACLNAVTEIVDKGFEDFSYGFRPHRGIQDVYEKVKSLYGQGLTHVGTFDVVKAFDNLLMANVRRALNSKDLPHKVNWLANEILHGAKDRNRLVGVSQGNPLSGMFFNLVMDSHYDKVILSKINDCLKVIRYVDDVIVIGRTKELVEGAIAESVGILARINLGTAKLQVCDLNQEKIELLGLTASSDNNTLKYELTDSAWITLDKKLDNAYSQPDPPNVIKLTLSGWRKAKPISWTSKDQSKLESILDKHGLTMNPRNTNQE